MTAKGEQPWGIKIRPFAVDKTYFLSVNLLFFENQMQHSFLLHARNSRLSLPMFNFEMGGGRGTRP